MGYKRYENESDEALIYRICEDKEQIGTWEDVAAILNGILGTNYSSAKFRKPYQGYIRTVNNNQALLSDSEELLELIRQERRELEKEKVKFRDERNEYNRLIRQEARKESYKDLIIRTIQEHDPVHLDSVKPANVSEFGNDLIIHLTDLHTGIKIDNWFNRFDETVLKSRLQEFLEEILSIRETHMSTNAYVIIGEILSGLIHENLRCENNQNLIEQFLTAADYITDFLTELAKNFKEVHVFVTPGNHSRVSAKKEQNLKGENFDNLLIPLLSARMQNIKSVRFFDNTIEESVAMFSVRGNVVMAAHGDKDSPESVVQKFTMLFGMKPDLVYLGHKHTNGMKTVGHSKVIQSGCLSGTDNYAIDKRLNSSPEQTVSVVDSTGLVCLYDIQLG